MKNLILKLIKKGYRQFSKIASPIDVEKVEQIFYINYLREGMTIFDVGANVGELSLLFSRFVGGSGKVHVFEVSKLTFEKLKEVIKISNRSQIVLNHNAVTDQEKLVNIHIYDDEYASWNSLADRPLENYGIKVKSVSIEEVQAITIDLYCKKIILLKLIYSKLMLRELSIKYC